MRSKQKQPSNDSSNQTLLKVNEAKIMENLKLKDLEKQQLPAKERKNDLENQQLQAVSEEEEQFLNWFFRRQNSIPILSPKTHPYP